MKKSLNRLYRRYSRREYLHPDPLTFVYTYPDERDREVAGFIAASFALGRVSSICSFLEKLFSSFRSPCADLVSGEGIARWETDGPHYYRFYKKDDIRGFLEGTAFLLKLYGSLEEAFLSGYRLQNDVWQGLCSLVSPLRARCVNVVPDPRGGSACKRLHMFLRWMVRSDAIDPGLWKSVSPSCLLYPVDTHILRIARELGITARRQADRKTAEEITAFFRCISPDDPVKYDFSLSRFGIHPELDYTILYTGIRISA